MVTRQNIEMVRGDTLSFTIEADGDIGTVSAVAMTVRDIYDEQKFTINTSSATPSGAGSITTNTSNRKWTVRVAPAATSSLPAGTYNYDVQMTIGSDIYTPIHGRLVLLLDMTR